MRRTVPLLLLSAVLASSAWAGKDKKPKGPTGPTAPGWFREASWAGDCWFPPDFSAMAEGPRRVAWNETREAMMSQWRGDRNDGVSFPNQAITDLETAMLAKPERVAVVAKENWDQCKAAMGGGGTTAWQAWVPDIAGRLTEGECPFPPLDYTAFNYLSVNSKWQNRLPVCRGDRIVLHATDADYYQIKPNGPWINAAGDTSERASGDLPCTSEGCYPGQLIMQFTSEKHQTMVVPVGLELVWLAPDHGRIEVMINDDDLSDNKYKVEGRLEHHTGIEVKPAE
ncbi:MAG: hypothetical protein H6738_21435 [Alphaproteobacteria bacterium]|nr:hypothetical protein [Alphaproteobacteria bacterium]